MSTEQSFILCPTCHEPAQPAGRGGGWCRCERCGMVPLIVDDTDEADPAQQIAREQRAAASRRERKMRLATANARSLTRVRGFGYAALLLGLFMTGKASYDGFSGATAYGWMPLAGFGLILIYLWLFARNRMRSAAKEAESLRLKDPESPPDFSGLNVRKRADELDQLEE